MAFVIIVATIHLVCVAIDYRRRGKPFWVWRLVSRSNGQYIVGNQHVLFSACSIITAAVMIGYNLNCYRTFVFRQYLSRAYMWRGLVYLPLVVHGWVSSWANLQAAVLSSQRAANNHVLSPRLANGIYVGVFVILIVPLIVLPVYSAYAWSKFWGMAEELRDILVVGMRKFDQTGIVDYGQLALASSQRVRATEQLDFFIKTQQAVAGIYCFACLMIIAVNIGGLSLLLTLRRQIKFNTRRFSSSVRSGSRGGVSDANGTETATHHISTGPRPSVTGSIASSQPPSSFGQEINQNRRTSTASTLSNGGAAGRKVFFANVGSNGATGHISEEAEDDDATAADGTPAMSSSMTAGEANPLNTAATLQALNGGQENSITIKELKQTADEKAPGAAHMREQAKQILALRKVQWDLIVFVFVVVGLAGMFAGIAIWRAVSANDPRRNWISTECAFFLIPWFYLIVIGVALTGLVWNALRHLARPSSKEVTSVPVNGMHGNGGPAAHGGGIPPDSITGFSSISDDTVSGTGDVVPTVQPARRRSSGFAGGLFTSRSTSGGTAASNAANFTGPPATMAPLDEEEQAIGGRALQTSVSTASSNKKKSPSKKPKRRTSLDDEPAPVQFTRPWGPPGRTTSPSTGGILQSSSVAVPSREVAPDSR
ncbi:hypothetical protein OIO90_004382 [Microbotryomycetes sp. JL221]|nr:hypothetical protein OIO90_004382 [Microbotryomycetes sp. JL221]